MKQIEFVMDFRSYNFKKLWKVMNYQNADCLYISTFSLDLDEKLTSLINRFERIVLVVNPIPFSKQLKRKIGEPIDFDSNNFMKILENPKIELYFNRFLHSKIVASKAASYVGSANFTFHSKNSIESGYISVDQDNNLEIIESFKDLVVEKSICINTLIKSAGLNGDINKVQQGIDNIIPRYEELLEILQNSIKDYSGFKPDAGRKNLNDIATIIESLFQIQRLIERDFNSNELEIDEQLVSVSWETKLANSSKNINLLMKSSDKLQEMAKKEGLYDQLSLEDYDRFFGDGSTDNFVKHINAFDNAEKTLNTIKVEMTRELHSIRSYLYALSTLCKDYRDFNKEKRVV